MAELKTRPTKASAVAFVKSIDDETRRSDCRELLTMMKELTGFKPVMWGESIVGFGNYHYQYQSGREGDWFYTGFSPRKQNLTIYIMCGFQKFPALMKKLGKHKTSVSCLYIKRLDDIDRDVLRTLITSSIEEMKRVGGACGHE
ncbi:MAG: DUF1801 domain-containing protein [Planctomycetota bacterium]|nr:DUF1801 domain-containing protein [Planctomycetota bacterium]MDA1215080.1 DUF1801 domain-containing protein [Planctomycetota bacterium]